MKTIHILTAMAFDIPVDFKPDPYADVFKLIR